METRANFALVGALTLAVAFAAFTFVYWFSGAGRGEKNETYQIEFAGSVAGLSRGSAVQFNGLKVGEVKRLAISEADPSRVDVLVEIDKKTPVKTNTRARLEAVGFTGNSVVSLIGGTPGAPALVARESEAFPRIIGERSEIQNLLETVHTLSGHADEVLKKLNTLLETNSDTISNTIKNTDALVQSLSDQSGKIKSFISNAEELSRSMKPIAGKLDKVLSEGDKAIKALDPKALKTITGNMSRFTATGLRQYEMLATDGRKALNSIDRAVKSLERDPSQVIWGPSQPATEPAPATK